jgi:hypothetical protein
MPVTFTNKECADTHFICGFYNRKTWILQRITSSCVQIILPQIAIHFRILKETGFFPRVIAQRGHPRLLQDNVLGIGQRSPRSKNIHGISS